MSVRRILILKYSDSDSFCDWNNRFSCEISFDIPNIIVDDNQIDFNDIRYYTTKSQSIYWPLSLTLCLCILVTTMIVDLIYLRLLVDVQIQFFRCFFPFFSAHTTQPQYQCIYVVCEAWQQIVRFNNLLILYG